MKKQMDVEIPMVVNFIKVGGVQVDVKDFTDDELAQIGGEWAANLIANAKRRRSV